MGKPDVHGVDANQRLNFGATGEGSSTTCQGFKPDLINSAVRHYRGASENVAMVELGPHLTIERVRPVTLRLQLAHRSSIPAAVTTSEREVASKIVTPKAEPFDSE